MGRGPTGEEVTLDGELETSDGGDGLSPLSSPYSPCGESEFDRYCSANSVMGTPSVCSSMGIGMFRDSLESDFGSLKSLEDFSLGGGSVPRRFQESSHLTLVDTDRSFGSCSNDAFCGVNSEGEGLRPVCDFERNTGVFDPGSSSSVQAVTPMLGSKAEFQGVKVCNRELGKREDLAVLLKNMENALLQGVVAARSAAENLLECNHADEMEDDRCQGDDETSSRYEQSDGDDSMFNYGSDGGCHPNPYYAENAGDNGIEDAGSKTLVLMDSSVAFGCKDWEDFELDGTEENNGMQLPDAFWERQQSSSVNETESPDSNLVKSTCNESLQQQEEVKIEEKVTVGVNDFVGGEKSTENLQSRPSASSHSVKLMEALAVEYTSGTSASCSQVVYNDGSGGYLEKSTMYNIFKEQCSSICAPVDMGAMPCEKEVDNQDIRSEKSKGLTDCPVLQQDSDLPREPMVVEASLPPDVCRGPSSDDRMDSPVGFVSNSVSLWLEDDWGKNHDEPNLSEDKFTTSKGKDFEMDAYYDEVVHDMEEILLDSCDSSAMRLKQIYSMAQSPVRDGGSSASTSGWEDGTSLIHDPLKFDGIEVVGAKQRKGDVSLSERLVGVKEYTVYIIRVWSGKHQWEVERRYRDFYTLYRRLKTYFIAQEWILPSPWSFVEKESRKFFGNVSPHVVAERSTLIQECLSSILHSRYISSPPSALVSFLSPPAAISSSSESNAMVHQSTIGADNERFSTLGKTISLIVDIQSQKSVKELLDKQHYTCAGCHGYFDQGKTRVLEIAQSFGWGKPRFCEYTGQLFCSLCHKNETVVLPARVLHHWDFTPYPVSQLAKSYLDSIVDKPMLCVSAANPFLFSKVPTLLHIVGVRRRIGAMLPFIRCSFRGSVYRRLGYRKYLLETNDFFALRDLIDLSKGAFAALPAILEAVLKKIQQHITELCLECCDNGVPCGARQACNNPSSLIFPFQEEEEVQRCKSCNAVFHKNCFSKLVECPCRGVFKEANTDQSIAKLMLGNTIVRSSSLLSKKLDTKSPVDFISKLLSLSRPGKMKDDKEGDNVISMGSLPSTSL